MTGSLDTRRVLIPVAGRLSAAVDGEQLATATASAAKVRRYRLGRMPLYTRPGTISDRHAHLRRGYD